MSKYVDLTQALDPVFWDLYEDEVNPSKSSNTVKILRIEESVWDSIFAKAEEFRRNLNPIYADNLSLFSRMLGISNRSYSFSPPFNTFEVFRVKVLGVWMATQLMPSFAGINYVVGAYTFQPAFYERIADDLRLGWWLNRSFLDGVLPDAYDRPSTWLRSVFQVSSGFVLEVFSEAGSNTFLDVSGEFDEFVYVIRRMSGCYYFQIRVHSQREPAGFLLWGLGVGNFVLTNFEEFEQTFRLVEGVDEGEIMLDYKPVEVGLYRMNLFEILYSTEIVRKIYFRLSSWAPDEWREIEPYQTLRVENTGESIAFRIKVSNVKNRLLYRFVSLMLKKLDETYQVIWY